MPWTCPDCNRTFGRKNQSHGCAPSGTVDEYFADRPASLRRIYEAVARHIGKLGASIDPVTACIMFKRSRTFAEVRAKRDRLELAFLLSRAVVHPKIHKTLKLSAHRTAHFVELARVGDVDRDVRGWLTEAYASSPV
jgi:cyanophycinase-like exopeptidase